MHTVLYLYISLYLVITNINATFIHTVYYRKCIISVDGLYINIYT